MERARYNADGAKHTVWMSTVKSFWGVWYLAQWYFSSSLHLPLLPEHLPSLFFIETWAENLPFLSTFWKVFLVYGIFFLWTLGVNFRSHDEIFAILFYMDSTVKSWKSHWAHKVKKYVYFKIILILRTLNTKLGGGNACKINLQGKTNMHTAICSQCNTEEYCIIHHYLC